MNEILKAKEWKFQEVQEEIHNADTCGMCELTSKIRKAEHLATKITKVKHKHSRIPKGLFEGQKRRRMDVAKEKKHFSETHNRRKQRRE